MVRTDRPNARATSVCWAKPDSTKNTIACLSDFVLGAIVMHWQSGDGDHALIRVGPQAATRIDDHGIGRRWRGQCQGLLCAHARS
jgi:hypothetical protein